MSEWIACSERMPEIERNVIFHDQWESEPFKLKAGWWDGRRWCPNAGAEDGYVEDISEKAVTHWMPLPAPPEVE